MRSLGAKNHRFQGNFFGLGAGNEVRTRGLDLGKVEVTTKK